MCSPRLTSWIVDITRVVLPSPDSWGQQFASPGDHGQNKKHQKAKKTGKTERTGIAKPWKDRQAFGHMIPKQPNTKARNQQQHEKEGNILHAQADDVV